MSRLIVFEGGEGSGKSTQAALLASRLGAVLTREPGGTAWGRRIRSLVLDAAVATPLDVRAEALLMAADRAQHVSEVIRPALDQGKVVVSDRFVDSSLAYQGIARGLGLEEIYRISEWATGGLLPDVVQHRHAHGRHQKEEGRIDAQKVAVAGRSTAAAESAADVTPPAL